MWSYGIKTVHWDQLYLCNNSQLFNTSFILSVLLSIFLSLSLIFLAFLFSLNTIQSCLCCWRSLNLCLALLEILFIEYFITIKLLKYHQIIKISLMNFFKTIYYIVIRTYCESVVNITFPCIYFIIAHSLYTLLKRNVTKDNRIG